MKKLKKIPKFKTIAEEKIFWQTHDSMDYIDWSKAKRAYFSNLKKDEKLYECALSVEQDEALNEEMKDWDITIKDGL